VISSYSSKKEIKTELIRKMGQKASRWKFVGTTGHNAKKGDNPVLNETYDHPKSYPSKLWQT